LLDEAWQQADEHGAALGLLKAIDKDLNGFVGGDFAEIGAADSVGDCEEVAVGTSVLARGGNEEARGVFIVGSNFAWIGCLAELDFQHGRCRLGGFISRRIEPGQEDRLSAFSAAGNEKGMVDCRNSKKRLGGSQDSSMVKGES
jgi:hypothetical protein